MSNIRKFAVKETAVLHLRDASDELMYAEKEDGSNDETRPMTVELYGPGSKVYARTMAASENRIIDKLKAKGKVNETAEAKAIERATNLAACTKSMSNIELDGDDAKLTGADLYKAVYAESAIGFVADQVDAYLKSWGNFTKTSQSS